MGLGGLMPTQHRLLAASAAAGITFKRRHEVIAAQVPLCAPIQCLKMTISSSWKVIGMHDGICLKVLGAVMVVVVMARVC